MDKKKSVLNVGVSVAFKLILLFFAILTRRLLIQYIGNDINGLNSLYLSIIGVLSVAELGIGTAITFSMYSPIVNKEYKKISALFSLFRKTYLIISSVIFIGGCVVLPFLNFFAKDYSNINQNIYLTFFIMLISTVLTYTFSSKISLINAYKDNYITTIINSGGMVFQYIFQICALIWTRSFTIYLLCRIIAVLLQWVVTESIFKSRYSNNLYENEKLDNATKLEVIKNVKAMVMHKVGSVLVNSSDSIIISSFIGVTILGKYTNYSTIMSQMIGVLVLVFTPLTSIIGHMCVSSQNEEKYSIFKFFYGVNYILGCIFFLGYYATINDIVAMCFGNNLEIAKSIVFTITVNYFVQFMRQSVMVFREATGTFYYDRWKPLAEGVCNIVLSVLLVLILPDELKVAGVIIATILTNIFVCHIVEPYVMFKHGLQMSPKNYYVYNYFFIGLFMLILFAFSRIIDCIYYENIFIDFIVKGIIAVLFGIVPCTVHLICNVDFRINILNLVKRKKDK